MKDITARAEAPKILWIGIMLAFARLILSQESYNKFLYNKASKIDKYVFHYYAHTLIECLKLTKECSSKYRNSELETQCIVTKFTLFKPYYNIIYSIVREHRLNNGLKP